MTLSRNSFLESPWYTYLPTPSYDVTQGQFLSRILKNWIQCFSFFKATYHTEVKEPSRPYYFFIARGRIIGFIPYPRVLVIFKMQSASSRIWTRVAVSISFDDNHYSTGTISCVCVCVACLWDREILNESLNTCWPWLSIDTDLTSCCPISGISVQAN